MHRATDSCSRGADAGKRSCCRDASRGAVYVCVWRRGAPACPGLCGARGAARCRGGGAAAGREVRCGGSSAGSSDRLASSAVGGVGCGVREGMGVLWPVARAGCLISCGCAWCEHARGRDERRRPSLGLAPNGDDCCGGAWGGPRVASLLGVSATRASQNAPCVSIGVGM